MKPEIIPGLQVLGEYFSGRLPSLLADFAGSNEMPHGFFSALTDEQKTAMFADFLEWDQARNPDGWQAVINAEQVWDFQWASYFMGKLAAMLEAEAAKPEALEWRILGEDRSQCFTSEAEANAVADWLRTHGAGNIYVDYRVVGPWKRAK
tara:strand:+ start:10962 stop:11411 length:450 start_codon:yes stop_codon:yes gene_type:complete